MANKQYRIYERPGTKKRSSRKKKLLLIIVALLVILGAIIATLELTDTTHFFHHKKNTPAPTAGQSTKGEVSGSGSKTAQTAPTGTSSVDTPGSSNSAQPGDQKSNTQTSGTANLTAPSGDFVSAHHVTLTTAISSVCNTTSGATCQITFTQGGVSRSLTAQIADRGGSAYWNNWTPKSISLTTGTWSIQAVATLSGQTKTAADALDLVVSQ